MNNLNNEEEELLRSVEKGEWKSKPNLAQRKQVVQQYAQEQVNSETHIDIALSANDFERLKSFASKQGINYQVVAKNILHQYLNQI